MTRNPVTLTHFLEKINSLFSPQEGATYIKPLQAALSGECLYLYTSNRYMSDWLNNKIDIIQETACALLPGVQRVIVKVGLLHEKADAGMTFLERLKAAGIPKKYYEATLNSLYQDHPKQISHAHMSHHFVKNFRSIKNKGMNLLFCGDVGTGKTYLACALINQLIRHHFHCRLERVSRLIRRVQSTYQANATQTEQAIINEYIRYDLLVIDELGLHRHTETTLLILSDILCERADHLRPTILISNWPDKGTKENPGIREMLGTRIYDRLLDCGSKVLVFDWHSYRGKKA